MTVECFDQAIKGSIDEVKPVIKNEVLMVLGTPVLSPTNSLVEGPQDVINAAS